MWEERKLCVAEFAHLGFTRQHIALNQYETTPFPAQLVPPLAWIDYLSFLITDCYATVENCRYWYVCPNKCCYQ